MAKSDAERWMDAGFAWWRLTNHVAETMVASQAVMTRRMGMMGKAARNPNMPPPAELARMAPEKVVAFHRAGTQASAARSEAAGKAAAGDALAGLHMLESALAISAAWWAPVHATATSNARRLGRTRRRR